MPVTFALVCRCGTAKTRAEDGRSIWWCKHCDRDCTKSHCPECKKIKAERSQR